MATTEMRLNSQRRIIQPAGTLDDPEFDESHSHHQSQQHGGHHGESHHTETHSSIGRALLDSTVRLFGNRAPKLSINVHTAPIVFRGSAEHASGAVLSGQLVIRLHEPLKVRAIRLTLTSREKSSYVVILQAGVPTVREESRTAFEYEWMLPLSTQSRSHTPRHGATVTGGGGGGSNNSPAMTPITASASATGASYFDQQHHHQHHHHHHNPDAIDVLHSIGSAGQSPRIGRAHTSSQTPGGAITPGGTNSSSNNNIGGGGSGGGSNSAVLAAGVHVFDFSVGLPGSLPETTHTPFGSSTHELRAIIERSGFRPNLTCSRFIQVTRRQLTYEHYDSVPILVDGEFDEAKAAYQVFLPRRLVTAGETIEVQVTIDNKSKKNYVDYISAMISEQVEVKSVEGVSLRQLTRPISRTKITNTTAVDYEKGGGRFNSTRTTTAESTAATTITTSSSSGNNNGNNNNSSSGGNGKMTLEKVLQSAAQSGDEIKLFVRIKVPQLYDGIQPDATDGLMRVRHRLTIALKALDEDRRPQSVIIKLPLSIEARLQPYGSHHPDDPLLQGLENMNLSNEYNDEMDFLPVYTPYDVSSAVSPADTPPEYADVPTSPPPPPPYSELQQDHLGRTSTTTSSSS
ncbi:hypothetical protein GQ42DRAFT_160438 [Ramicandelaber brevisporus]|nr:hypothetical protein GQ42DRAFT_160438 [Ramicandelaber brevisporus]